MQIIISERLILRPWKESDLKPFTKINQDPKVLEYIPYPYNEIETQAFMDRIKDHFTKHGFGLWATELIETGEFIGYIGLNLPQFQAPFMPAIEIGWRLDPAYWGKGYATEGAKKVLTLAFELYKLPEIVSFTAKDNQRSIRVMEKIGLKRDLEGDFYHPLLPKEHKLALHILYRLQNPNKKL
jgi:3-dehydroquinate dehydratase/shikimate dehydrogenase